MTVSVPVTLLQIQLFGALRVVRGTATAPVPSSRKTRAILGYLALSPRPVSRQRLCDLFFDLPDDPRAALRWSLTKIRPLVDEAGRPRLIADRDQLSMDLVGTACDVLQVQSLAAKGLDACGEAELKEALGLMSQPLLEDAELPDRVEYTAWLTSMRHEMRTLEQLLIEARLRYFPGTPEAQALLLHRLTAIDPLNEPAYIRLAETLVQAGRLREAQAAVASAERTLAQAGIRAGPALRAAGRPRTGMHRLDAQPPASPAGFAAVKSLASRRVPDHQPSLGIVSFRNHSPGDLPDAWAEGFLEAVIHNLARFKTLRIAALSAGLQFKQAGITDPKAVASALGVRDLIGGSLMVRDGMLKVRYRMVDSEDSALFANGDIDLPLAGYHTLLEDAPAQLVFRIFHHVVGQSILRASSRPDTERDSRDHTYLGLAKGILVPPLDPAGALEHFEAALSLSPDLPMALAYAAYFRSQIGDGGVPELRELAIRRAKAAISKAGDDGQVMAVAAWSLLQFEGDTDAALRMTETAIRFNPLGRVVWNMSAWVRAMAGEYETAMLHWDHAERCNPLGGGIDQTFAGRALCAWIAGRPDEARNWAKRCLEISPDHPLGLVAAIAAAAELGMSEESGMLGGRFHSAHADGLATPVIADLPIRDRHLKERLIMTVRAALKGGGLPAEAGGAAGRASGPPVVAVLPFHDLSSSPAPKHIPAGLFEGLTHALSRFRSIVVVSAASAARFANKVEDPVQIAGELGADLLVGGSLIASENGELRLRWNAIDGASGHILKAGEIRGSTRDLWNLHETAANEIAVEVEPQAQAEAFRVRKERPTESAQAYDYYLRGLFAGFSVSGRNYAAALECFEQALRLDPAFHAALAMAPWAAAYSNSIRSPDDLAKYAAMSREALRQGRDDARTQAVAGTALFYFAHEFSAARAAIERAISLNPNEYTAWICGGWMHAMKGEADLAQNMFDRAERLNPLAYGANGLLSGRAMADFMAGRIAEAERHIDAAFAVDEGHPSALMTGIATAAALGLQQAREKRRRDFLAIYPDGLGNLAIQALPFEDPACRERYFSAVARGLAD